MRSNRTILRLGGLTLTLALFGVGCGDPSPTGDGVLVVVTTNILGDVVQNVVGLDARVEVLMPIGADAHEFQASAAQVALINRADLVVANGLGLEAGLAAVLTTARADGVNVFEVAPLLDPLPFEADHHDADAGDLDPHFWMDPVRVAEAAGLIGGQLTAIAPGIDWATRADTYSEELLDAHSVIEAMLDEVPPGDRIMVTNHATFGYFAERYGWEIVGTVIPGGSSLGAPSAADLADLINTIETEGVTAIFVETTSPDAVARVVAAEVGETVEVVELHTESLGPPGGHAETLIGMLQDNARRITDSLTR